MDRFRAPSLNGFENGPNLAENSIEYVLLITWDENSIFSSANRARSGPQKLPWNGFTKWNFLKIRKKHIRIGNKFDCVGGVSNASERAFPDFFWRFSGRWTPSKRGVLVLKNSFASCQRYRHSVEPCALKCNFKQSNLSAWSPFNWHPTHTYL